VRALSFGETDVCEAAETANVPTTHQDTLYFRLVRLALCSFDSRGIHQQENEFWVGVKARRKEYYRTIILRGGSTCVSSLFVINISHADAHICFEGDANNKFFNMYL
jgi:hypothetical protein